MGEFKAGFTDTRSPNPNDVDSAYLNTLGRELDAAFRAGPAIGVCSRRLNFRRKTIASQPQYDSGQVDGVYSLPEFQVKQPIGSLDNRLSTNSTTGLHYLYLDHGPDTNNIRRIGLEFSFETFGKVAATGGVCVVLMNMSHGAVQTLNTGRLGVHLIVTPLGWTIQKASNATGSLVFTNLSGFWKGAACTGGGVWANALLNTTRTYRLDAIIVGNTLAIWLPDGSTAYFTDVDIPAWSLNYGFHEVSVNDAATDCIPGLAEIWADSSTIQQHAPLQQFITGDEVFAWLARYQPLDTDLTAIAALTSAANKIAYATGAGTWALADFTAAGRALVDDADAAAQRATLGLGNAVTQAASNITSAAGITTLVVTDNPIQRVTGATTQTIKLPTTGVVAGDHRTVINDSTGVVTVQSSGGNTLYALPAGTRGTFIANQATPTTAAHWSIGTTDTSAASGTATPTASTVSKWDANINFSANNFLAGYNSTATAAGTTTLNVGSSKIQVFTGSSTQNCDLPTTSVVAGHTHEVINLSTGDVTVRSSAGNTILVMPRGCHAKFVSKQATPTSNSHWDYVVYAGNGRRRVQTQSGPGATPTIDGSLYDQVNLDALAAAITNLSSGLIIGTEILTLRFKDNGTARAIADSGAKFRAMGTTLSTTTVVSKYTFWTCIPNLTDAVYDVVGVAQQA